MTQSTKTKCDEIQERLDLYLDHELADDEIWELESHTESCAECYEILEERKELKLALHKLSRMTPSDDFKSRLNQALSDAEIASDSKELKHEYNYYKTAFFAAAAILAAIFVYSYLNSNDNFTSNHEFEQQSYLATNDQNLEQILEETSNWLVRSSQNMEITGTEEEISNWFRPPKIDFPLRFPEIESSELLGGRLGNINSNAAAIIMYNLDSGETDNKSVSVIVLNNQTIDLNYHETPILSGSFNGYNGAVREYSDITYVFISSTVPIESLMEIAKNAF